MKIAIATTDKETVNLHFGKTECFSVYEFKHNKLLFSNLRFTLSYRDPKASKDHPFDEKRFEQVFEAIKDCKKVVVFKIGNKPKTEFLKRGMEVIEYDGEIKDLIK